MDPWAVKLCNPREFVALLLHIETHERSVAIGRRRPGHGRPALAVIRVRRLHCDPCASIAEAKKALAQPLQLALLDVGLPDGNGFDLLRDIREHHPKLPVIMLTARGEAMDRVLGLELGADDYLPKPFETRELTARIRAVLRRASPKKSKPIRWSVSIPVAVKLGFEIKCWI